MDYSIQNAELSEFPASEMSENAKQKRLIDRAANTLQKILRLTYFALDSQRKTER
jgi:hypothetical protein